MNTLFFLKSLSALLLAAAASLAFLKIPASPIVIAVPTATFFFLYLRRPLPTLTIVLALTILTTLAFRWPIHLAVSPFTAALLLSGWWTILFAGFVGWFLRPIAKDNTGAIH